MGISIVRRSLYLAVVIIILTLTGIFNNFAGRIIVQDVIELDVLSMILMLGLSGYFIAKPYSEEGTARTLGVGVVASIIIGMALVAVILLESIVPQEGLIFIFRNYAPLVGSTVTFGYGEDNLVLGIVLLLSFSAFMGLLGGAIASAPSRLRNVVLGSFAVTIIMGLMEAQIDNVMALPDAVTLSLAFGLGYGASKLRPSEQSLMRIVTGFIPGAIIGVLIFLIAGAGMLAEGGLFYTETTPQIIGANSGDILSMVVIFGLVGSVGALLTIATGTIHNGGIFLLVTLVALGMLNSAERMTAFAALFITVIFAIAIWLVPEWGRSAENRFNVAPRGEQRSVNRLSGGVGLFIVLIAPLFLSQYITNVLDIVMLYIIMGIGLNVMVGFAGLLDLGYVASFAIGAYTSALMTTTNIITTGCTPIINASAEALGIADAPNRVAEVTNVIQSTLDAGRSLPSALPDFAQLCTSPMMQAWDGTGILSFWGAWPIAILVAAFTGMALGVPVLRLRGDYLAIVTLGFGEITRVLVRSNVGKPLLGASQGISPVPFPVLDLTGINPSWYFELSDASSIYYLYVFAVLVAAFVAFQLVDKRLGRAWRAMKADEDVAEAMGVHLVGTKLLAFGISSAFAGLGGAIFAAQLRGIFPDSFTILVSINVLSLIIIGGLGSIKGVFLGALMLVGLPEALRELQDYRLLAFGALLVIVMLAKPEGLLPPRPTQLSEKYHERKQKDNDATPPNAVVEGGTQA
jgi:branched-chain amino acid transport system permease protein